jgi:hypothetical protein
MIPNAHFINMDDMRSQDVVDKALTHISTAQTKSE